MAVPAHDEELSIEFQGVPLQGFRYGAVLGPDRQEAGLHACLPEAFRKTSARIFILQRFLIRHRDDMHLPGAFQQTGRFRKSPRSHRLPSQAIAMRLIPLDSAPSGTRIVGRPEPKTIASASI